MIKGHRRICQVHECDKTDLRGRTPSPADKISVGSLRYPVLILLERCAYLKLLNKLEGVSAFIQQPARRFPH